MSRRARRYINKTELTCLRPQLNTTKFTLTPCITLQTEANTTQNLNYIKTKLDNDLTSTKSLFYAPTVHILFYDAVFNEMI